MRLKRKRVPGKQKGVVTIEAVFVLPLLFMLLFFILDFGRIFHQMVAVTDAAHFWATYCSQSPAVALECENAIPTVPDNNDFTVSASCPKEGDEDSGCKMHIAVTVEGNFSLITGFLPLPKTLKPSQTTTFRVQP